MGSERNLSGVLAVTCIIAMVFLQVIDYQTTRIGIGNGATEMNGFVLYIINNFGWKALLIFKLVLGLYLGVVASQHPLFGLIIGGFYMWVCYSNIEVLARLISS